MKHGSQNPGDEKIKDLTRKIAEDKVFDELLKRSSLTRKQAETLIFDVMSQRDGVMLTSHQRAALRGVTKGSFLRTRKQALRNVQKSLFTLILLSYLGIIKLPQYRWFFDLSEAFEEKDWETVKQFLSELEGR
ncbi:MAG: hypothetical protein RMI43_06975 [Candidatus Caldarchaeum sp.]|nr:hypothetical protein [Candidatus Caldarchaeum sp.]MDW8063896.1 hypothetical protein [Candidatus Caldarchaeum sp.]MDW8435008.1 hypothetical protein [Candidatus Caldarchaeum sp.]